MTQILGPDFFNAPAPARATRRTGEIGTCYVRILEPGPTRPTTRNLVPSQLPETYQAVDIPEIWPVSSRLPSWFWGAASVVVIGACAIAALVNL